MARQYSLNELQIGMQVRESELHEIIDTYIVLNNTKIIDTEDGNDLIGTIWFIGSSLDDKYAKLNRQGQQLGIVYNRSMDREGLVDYYG